VACAVQVLLDSLGGAVGARRVADWRGCLVETSQQDSGLMVNLTLTGRVQ
jgi:hypothetical protein